MSEQPRHVITGHSYRYVEFSNKILIHIYSGHHNSENAEEGTINICFDTLYEIICFGDRRKLTQVENVGRMIHQIGETYFAETPFIRFDLTLDSPRYVV